MNATSILQKPAASAEIGMLDSMEQYFQKIGLELLIRVIVAIIVIIIAVILIRKLTKAIKKRMERNGRDLQAINTMRIIVRMIAYTVLAFVIFSVLGLPVSSGVYILVALVIAIIIALKDYVSTITSGLYILITRPFKLGDKVSLSSGECGNIIKVTPVYTQILTIDRKVINLPNNVVTKGAIINHIYEGERMLFFKVNVAYNTNIDQARKILEKIFNESSYHLKERDVRVVVESFNDFGFELQAMMPVVSSDYDNLRWEAGEKVLKEFAENGIVIPYPQMVLHQGDQTQKKENV